jgi:CAP-Gly domain-containing linker protein 1
MKRYELEDRIAELEVKLATQAAKSANHSRSGSTAPTTAEIDNETLREQVLHQQKKITHLDDMIEDLRVNQEREEAQVRDRLTRAKEKEDALKKELAESRRETERILKAEANARHRIEEIEEAFRESTVALENARAEVENLRAELDVSAEIQCCHFG